jgi:hypothetical protein
MKELLLILTILFTISCKKEANKTTNSNSTNTTPPVTYTDYVGNWKEVNTPTTKLILTRVVGTTQMKISNNWIWTTYIHSCYTNDIIDDTDISHVSFNCSTGGNYVFMPRKQSGVNTYDTLHIWSGATGSNHQKFIRE